MDLGQLKTLFQDAGCTKLYAKPLAENDNSKNQVYLGPDFQALNLLPNLGILAESDLKSPIFKAKLNFAWLLPDNHTSEAPYAQLILYPQYPEVRFSGFLKGSRSAPSELMASRQKGRILFLGIKADNQIVGFVVGANSEISNEFFALRLAPTLGVFIELELPRILGGERARTRLLQELGRIHRLGWIDSKQLAADGSIRPCTAQQCGGFTLEAELGISKNSRAEPDFLGWEVKQHKVRDFEHLDSSVITLMTPEPTGGYYRERGLEAFVRRFGYEDKLGRADRLNFGGIHRTSVQHPLTGMTLTLAGYDAEQERVTDARGAIVLISKKGELAAAWEFGGLISHWTRKHAKAVYVPSLCHKEPKWQYAYGPKVRLAQQTDFLRFLNALAKGIIYYDPAIKVEQASTPRPKHKARSQFRFLSRHIPALYETVELVTI